MPKENDNVQKIQKKHYLKALEILKNKKRIHRQIPYELPQTYVNAFFKNCGWEGNTKTTQYRDLVSNAKRYALRHNWHALACCIKYLLETDTPSMPIIWRSTLMVLLNHPESTPNHISEFMQSVVSLRTEEERSKFLTDIMTLPENIHRSVKRKRKGFNEIEHEDEEDEDD